MAAYCRGTELADVFDLLSTTKDARGKVYVSTVQAKRYPFIATQWHPEKNLFEFSSPSMPHSLPAKLLAQAFANQFVTVCAFFITADSCHVNANFSEQIGHVAMLMLAPFQL
jgi:hypothetical protein